MKALALVASALLFAIAFAANAFLNHHRDQQAIMAETDAALAFACGYRHGQIDAMNIFHDAAGAAREPAIIGCDTQAAAARKHGFKPTEESQP